MFPKTVYKSTFYLLTCLLTERQRTNLEDNANTVQRELSFYVDFSKIVGNAFPPWKNCMGSPHWYSVPRVSARIHS